ncbi:MAG TPA: hypothetical protein VH083_22730 [Myxococcales bacterium]|nr:hypothetical protein [Myxococcales bacterium]
MRGSILLAALLSSASALAQQADPGITRVEAQRVKDDAAAAQEELDRGSKGHEPGMPPEGSRDPRDAASERAFQDKSCPDGMVPLLEDGKRVAGEDGLPACRFKRQFIKGELTNLGSDKLVVKDSRFGIGFGYAHLDNASYLSINPEVDFHFGKDWALGLGVPLNIRAYADGFYDTGKIKLRTQDYNNPSDYARILRFLTYGRKEDQVYFNVTQLFAASIGHGAIVRRYFGNVDTNITRVGAELDAYGKYGGIESYVGDVVQPQHFLAGLAFIKPLGFIDGPLRETLGWTSIGVSTGVDFAAPYTLDRGPNGFPLVGDSDVCPTQPTAATCQNGEPIAQDTRRAQVVGIDLETKIVKTEGADIKPYIDYSRLLDIDNPLPGERGKGGGGFTLGMLGRFNAGDVKVHAFRVVVEGRYYDGNYLPGYFDTFYEVQKYQYITGKADSAYEPKLRTILNRDPAHKRAGFYVEAAYQYNNGLAFMASYEDSFHVSGPDSICNPCVSAESSIVGSRNLTLHLEYPAYSWLQFFGSFYRRSFDSGAFIDTSRPLGDNTLIYSAVRIHALWILFLNARLFRSWQADPVLGEMKNLWGGSLDLEFGYEFNRSKG